MSGTPYMPDGRPDDSIAKKLWPEGAVPLINVNLKLHQGDESGDFHYELADENVRLVVIEQNPLWPAATAAIT